MPELDIAPEKVAWLIVRAREYDAKVAAFDSAATDAYEQPGAILENRRLDPTREEITGFIRALNQDEQANLVALVWVGRGTYAPDEWESALETARQERRKSAVGYLLGIPMLAEYLEAALDAFGYSAKELEESVT